MSSDLFKGFGVSMGFSFGASPTPPAPEPVADPVVATPEPVVEPVVEPTVTVELPVQPAPISTPAPALVSQTTDSKPTVKDKNPERTGRAPIFKEGKMEVDAFMCTREMKMALLARTKEMKSTLSKEDRKKVSKAMLIRVGIQMVLESSDETVLQWINAIIGGDNPS